MNRDRLIELLAEAVKAFPHLRVGQLLVNISESYGPARDPFVIDDDELVSRLELAVANRYFIRIDADDDYFDLG